MNLPKLFKFDTYKPFMTVLDIKFCLRFTRSQNDWNFNLSPDSLHRRANNGVSRYPSYQKIFGLTENLEWNYRTFVEKMDFVRKLPLFWNENLIYVKMMPFCSQTISSLLWFSVKIPTSRKISATLLHTIFFEYSNTIR